MSTRGAGRAIPAWATVLLIVGVMLALIGIISAVALSGIFGTGFALSWMVALVVGAFGAVWVVGTFKDRIQNITVGMLAVMIGIVLLVMQILPDFGLIIVMVGAFTLIFAFLTSPNARSVGQRIGGAPPATPSH